MDNKNTVSLSQNSETNLMGDMAFKIADDVKLRFYPKVGYVISTENGTTPTGTGVATPTVTSTSRVNVTSNATATLTAAKPPEVTAAPTAAAPTTAATATPKGEPGFEAVFAIAGLLAVAFLVLRQRK